MWARNNQWAAKFGSLEQFSDRCPLAASECLLNRFKLRKKLIAGDTKLL